MHFINFSDSQSHSYNKDKVRVTEFNFSNNNIMNDAEIIIRGRYPKEGYILNEISTALVSVESGSATFTLKDQKSQQIRTGDRLLIKPGEPYVFNTDNELLIRYIATPAWSAQQSRIIE